MYNWHFQDFVLACFISFFFYLPNRLLWKLQSHLWSTSKRSLSYLKSLDTISSTLSIFKDRILIGIARCSGVKAVCDHTQVSSAVQAPLFHIPEIIQSHPHEWAF